MERDVELQLMTKMASLQATVESGFRHVSQRLDQQDETLRSVELEVKRTNGRVTRIEEQIRTLFRAVRTKVEQVGERTGITRRDVTVFVAGGGALIGAWKFVAWASAIVARIP
jgi:hypothetical protein